MTLTFDPTNATDVAAVQAILAALANVPVLTTPATFAAPLTPVQVAADASA